MKMKAIKKTSTKFTSKRKCEMSSKKTNNACEIKNVKYFKKENNEIPLQDLNDLGYSVLEKNNMFESFYNNSDLFFNLILPFLDYLDAKTMSSTCKGLNNAITSTILYKKKLIFAKEIVFLFHNGDPVHTDAIVDKGIISKFCGKTNYPLHYSHISYLYLWKRNFTLAKKWFDLILLENNANNGNIQNTKLGYHNRITQMILDKKEELPYSFHEPFSPLRDNFPESILYPCQTKEETEFQVELLYSLLSQSNILDRRVLLSLVIKSMNLMLLERIIKDIPEIKITIENYSTEYYLIVKDCNNFDALWLMQPFMIYFPVCPYYDFVRKGKIEFLKKSLSFKSLVKVDYLISLARHHSQGETESYLIKYQEQMEQD